LQVVAKFAEDLAAGAAGGGGFGGRGVDGDADDLAVTGGDGVENGGAFGAVGEAEGCVLDVAAGEDGTVGGLDGGANGELGVGGVGVIRGGAGGFFEDGSGHSCLDFRFRNYPIW